MAEVLIALLPALAFSVYNFGWYVLTVTAVSAAALAIYDMCKAVQKDMRIEDIRLLSKSGGRSGAYESGE